MIPDRIYLEVFSRASVELFLVVNTNAYSENPKRRIDVRSWQGRRRVDGVLPSSIAYWLLQYHSESLTDFAIAN